MKADYKQHIISSYSTLKESLARLNKLGSDSILFVVDSNNCLIGSLTDGDVRRGLIEGLNIEDNVDTFLRPNPKFITKHSYHINDIIDLRENKFRIIPVLNGKNQIIDIINFTYVKSYLPLDCVIMAGGRGMRLRPLTDTVPKPLLMVGNKPILEHNIDHLCKYGIDNFWLSIRYLGEQLEDYFKDGSDKDIFITYVKEDEPLGTIGVVHKIENFQHDYVLICNSDILTTLDYEQFFLDFLESDADMSVATIPYNVEIPYAVLETVNNKIYSFKEKPTYTYYSNGGIYLVKKDVLKLIPKNTFFNATDLMDMVIKEGMNLVSYPMRNYWLDIGKPADYEKAKSDIDFLEL
ncbi:MAG: nucleotidyltransferase family protein [Haliscomenobacter sp.]|nr:nucleotidyltransferase family protein [Haliscomenobacter sp.]